MPHVPMPCTVPPPHPVTMAHRCAEWLYVQGYDPVNMADMTRAIRDWDEHRGRRGLYVGPEECMAVDDALHDYAERIHGPGTCGYLKDRPDKRTAEFDGRPR